MPILHAPSFPTRSQLRWTASLRTGLAAALLLTGLLNGVGQAEEHKFALKDQPGQALDVQHNGKTVARYQYAYDNSSPETLHETYKPYLHVMDAAGEYPITKGAGGQYTHHRGIFIGWNKILHNGKTYDRWHMKGGDIVHQKFTEQTATDEKASFTSVTHWNTPDGEPLIIEERTLTFHPGTEPARLIIDFTSKLTPQGGAVVLNGDPEHAGVHYRPSNDVDRQKTVYLFPQEGNDPKKDVDLPWVGETYTLKDKQHSVVHINHPKNPTGTLYSAYRDYGRFGAFFVTEIPEGESLTLNYRFLILDGELPERTEIEKFAKEFRKAAE